MKVILGLDVSSVSTGVSVFKDGELTRDSLSIIPLKSKLHGERLVHFEEALHGLLEKHQPDEVVVEGIFRGPSPKTFMILAFYHGVARKVVFQHIKKEPIVIGSTEARRILENNFDIVLVPSKKGRVASKITKTSKELTFDFIKRRFALRGYKFKKDNDITDAIALCLAHSLVGENDERSVPNTRRRTKRNRSRSKKGLSKTSS